jgi:hypothetical protein
MADSITSKTLDELFSAMPGGSLDRAILNNLRGINHRQIQGMLPSNKDMPGYTFFVRPQLNMQKDNVRNVRKLSALLSSNPTSMQTYIRCMLDPRLMTGISYSQGTIPAIDCPIIDNLSAFIAPLTNNMVSMSGWPSISVPTFTSKPGLYNESYFMVDGRVFNAEVFDLNVNFRNTRGDPILYLFYVWAVYMSMVFEGKLVPYLDFITENELDYCTRIYRLVMDYKKQKVQKITACNVAIPTGVPVGDAFDVPGDKPYLEANADIGMRFKCIGVDYFDDILIKEFNETVGIFNPSMTDENRENEMIAVDPKIITYFNHKGYPHIDTKTMELKWYISTQDFNSTSTNILSSIPEGDADVFNGD